jgi:hypothetical protein
MTNFLRQMPLLSATGRVAFGVITELILASPHRGAGL